MSILKSMVQYIKDRHAEAPSTSSTLWAAWRTGLKDLQDIVLNAFPDSHKSRDEPGSAGNPTIQEVFRDRQNLEINNVAKATEQTPLTEATKQPEREKSREPELG